ncbi:MULTISPECIES: DMT family transporter [unclassified Gemella]|uniref:DMT family transporter n=1 Tax=unclassified Gemella TaxID=2624949 RepID=UPI001C057FB9|nr:MULTISPECIES: DMT family transporter [unclassified Gemella]MBU0279238.1 DMT family transporter [Gemella sp. zg-1178]QWQ39045.1 DMT family transporter [Gemella sp. zg-570]
MKNKSKVYIGLFSGLFWGMGLTLSGLLFSIFDVSPFLVSLVHDFFSLIFLGLLIVIKYGKINFKIFSSMKNYSLVLAAILAGPLGMQFNLYAVKYLGAGFASSVTAIYPGLAVVLSIIFLKNKVNKETIFGIILIVLALFSQTFEISSGARTYLGILFGLLCALSWASESVLSSYAMDNDLRPIEALFIRQTTSFLAYLLIIIFNKVDFNFVAKGNFILIVVGMVLANMLSYLLYYAAINYLQASKATGLNVTYVIWTAVFSFIILGTDLTIRTIISSFVIILGVYIIIREK